MTVAHFGSGHMRKADVRSEEGWFASLDARAKLVGVLLFVTATALLTRTYLLIASLTVALIFALASGVPLHKLARAYLVALPFVLIASVSVFVFGSVERGLDMWIRVSACVLALQVLALGTETFDLFSGLRRLKLPAVLTTLTMLTYRYLLLFVEEFERMKIARKARGFSGGRNLLDKYGLRVLSNTAGMLLVRSSSRADRIYEALTARGFTEQVSYWRKGRLGLAGATFFLSFSAVSLVLIALQLKVIL